MNKEDRLDKYFTMPQALTALGYPVNFRTVMYRAVKRGILSEPVRIAGSVLFLRDEVAKWKSINNGYVSSLPESDLSVGDVMSIRDAVEFTNLTHETLYKYSTLRDKDAPIQHGTFCGSGGFFVRGSVEQFKHDWNER